MTDRIYCDTLEVTRCTAKLRQNSKDWVEYSQQIAATMFQTNGGTWFDTTDAC